MKEYRPKLKKLPVGYQKIGRIRITECALAGNVVVMAANKTDLQVWNVTLIK